MNISKKNKMIIFDEFNFIIKSMEESPNINEKIYFLSAAHGMLLRIFNIEYDPDIVFAFAILKNVHDTFASTLMNPSSIQYIKEDSIDVLMDLLKQFCSSLKNDEPLDDILKRFVILTYSITGNGYYLKRKGMLKL